MRENDIDKLIEEINSKDDQIGELEGQLTNELTQIGKNLNRSEKFDEIYSGSVKSVIDNIAKCLIELEAKMRALEEQINDQNLENNKNGAGKGSGGQLQTLHINRVTNLSSHNNRWLAEHRIPGRAYISDEINSCIVQDLGRAPIRLTFNGVLTSKNDDRLDLQKKVEVFKWFFDRQRPLFFSSKLVNQVEVSKVIIEDLKIEENTSSPYMVKFYCSLSEYQEPGPQPQDTEIESKLKAQVQTWSEYQALKVVTRYRSKFIPSGMEITGDEVARRIAEGVILDNIVVKNNIGI
jgi:hypothetical protein